MENLEATAEWNCAEVDLGGFVSPRTSAQTANLKICRNPGKAIQRKPAKKTMITHGNKLGRQRQQKQAKCQHSVCVCFIFGAGDCVRVFVTVGRFLLCYWTGKRGRFVCLQSVFDLEPTIRGGAWKAKAMKNSSNCLDERELNL